MNVNKRVFSFLFEWRSLGFILALVLSVSVSSKAKDTNELESRQLTSSELSNPLSLTIAQRNLLDRMVVGTAAALLGIGNHQVIENQLGLLEFARALESRLYKMTAEAKLFFDDVDFGPSSSVRSALIESEWKMNPLLALVLEYVISPKTFAVPVSTLEDYLAYSIANEIKIELSKSNLEEIKEKLVEMPFRIPSSYNLSLYPSLDALLRKEAHDFAKSRAFHLNEKGQPRAYEPDIQNALAHTYAWGERLIEIGKRGAVGLFEQFSSHFYSLDESFSVLWSIVETVEYVALDMQGLIDAIRYKLTLEETNKRSEQSALEGMLHETLQLKREFLSLMEKMKKSHKGETASLPQEYRAMKDIVRELEQFRRKFKRHAGKTIDDIDRELGLDGDVEKTLRYDTPWEIEFALEREEARLFNLEGNWDEIRTFSIIVSEEYRTAHWTTQETEIYTDSNGETKTRQVTRHHNTSSTDYERETVHTPQEEIGFARKIEDLKNRLSDIRHFPSNEREAELKQVIDEVRSQKTAHAQYAEIPARGKDEDVHRVQRIRNLQEQFRNLEHTARIAGVAANMNIADFNRKIEGVPTVIPNVRKNLKQLDVRHWQRVKWTMMGAGTTGVVGAACWYFLSSGAPL